MIKFYGDNPSYVTRALQIYPILIGNADRNIIWTYKKLGQKLGYPPPNYGSGVLDKKLGILYNWCIKEKLPGLTSIIVNQDTGVPGRGATFDEGPAVEQQRVFHYQWYKLIPPTLEELQAVYDEYRDAA